jgi:hypothetical protein
MTDFGELRNTTGELQPSADLTNPLVLDRRITYDSSNAAVQWRCHMHLMKKTSNLVWLALVPLIFLLLERPLLFIIGVTVMAIGITLLPIAIAVYARTRSSRICTTALTEHGLNDVTPDSNKTLPWRTIKQIEVNATGDIFFLTGWGGGVFVPRCAFKSQAAAHDFYKHAKLLWERDRAQGNLAKIDADQVTKDLIANLNAEEESVWLALEQQHATLKPKPAESKPDQSKNT